MAKYVRYLCVLLLTVELASCSSSEKNRPHVYKGGQYYGDAWHAGITKEKPQ